MGQMPVQITASAERSVSVFTSDNQGVRHPLNCELNPLGETVNYGQLGCVMAPGYCAAARGWLDSNSNGDK